MSVPVDDFFEVSREVVLLSDAERIREERDEHVAEAVRLAAENLRYRAALEEIADSEFGPAAASIARAALDPGKVK